jgi:succinate dehydrogenase / fumarate reductase cytochrome b subunit
MTDIDPRNRTKSTAAPRVAPKRAGSLSRWRRLTSLYASSVGRKFVMAVSGLMIVGFVIVHLIGTLKIFLGPDSTNLYGEALRDLGGHLIPRTHLLWVFRIGLIAAFAVHIHAAFSLDRRNRRSRGPMRMSHQEYLAATYASRTMLWSGIIVGLFIVFHLADLTWGTLNPDFERGDAYNNQISSFGNPWISAIYLIGVAALVGHLFHGLWSLLQSVGASTALGERGKRRAAAGISIGIGIGYAAIPVAVLTGILDHANPI